MSFKILGGEKSEIYFINFVKIIFLSCRCSLLFGFLVELDKMPMKAFLRIRSLNIDPQLLVTRHGSINTILFIILMHLSGGHSLLKYKNRNNLIHFKSYGTIRMRAISNFYLIINQATLLSESWTLSYR